MKKKALIAKSHCVACGCCVTVCPFNAIKVHKGLYAVIAGKCVGCGKCAQACPACIIDIVEVKA